MADRNTTNGSTTPKPNGPEFLDEYSGHIGALYNNSLLVLTSVGGTADTITAAVDPVLPVAGLVTGMKFTISWAANNTGPATLQITGASAVDIVAKSGGPLLANQLAAGARDLLEYDGTNFVLLTDGEDTSVSNAGVTVYTVSGTWANNLPADTTIRVEAVAAGGGGSSQAGGAGGGYDEIFLRAGDLPATVDYVVPSGGALNTDGGDATFGAFLRAPGGGGGNFNDGGTAGFYGAEANISLARFRGGNGGNQSQSGGDAILGGGGGSGNGFTNGGGSSARAGAGGNVSVSGAEPGGGGGTGAPGARGEIRITVFG